MDGDDLANMIVSEVMTRWPETIRVFLKRRMHCPGCPMAPFMTVAEAAAEYGIAAAELTEELRTASDPAGPNAREKSTS